MIFIFKKTIETTQKFICITDKDSDSKLVNDEGEAQRPTCGKRGCGMLASLEEASLDLRAG